MKKFKATFNPKLFIKNILIAITGYFIAALGYNMFLVPNNLVVGGVSGLAIVFKSLYGWDTETVLLVGDTILILLSMLLLNKRSTLISLLGSFAFPAFVFMTKGLANNLLPYFTFDDKVVLALVAGLSTGLGYALIYKVGYDTGGSDIIFNIIRKYLKTSQGDANFISHILIILLGTVVFGVNKSVYAIIILFINSFFINKLTIGISDTKLFLVTSNNHEMVREYIINELNTGVTILEAKGGFLKKENPVLMVVVPNKDYYLFKERILEIDEDAFITVTDCYEVENGKRNKNILEI